MKLIQKKIYQYCENFSSPAPDYLNDLERKTYLKTLSPQMLSGMLQGRWLSMISKMLKPRRILEIGTFTGYSSLCLAEGLNSNGRLFTIEINAELEHIIMDAINSSPYSNLIEVKIGDAMDILPDLPGLFDLIFIDGAKFDYISYYKLIFDKWAKGGFLIADNVLWSGKILDANKDRASQAIQDFNTMILDDPAVENIILPLRDGINLIMKK